jgi:hypothetical protein
MVLFTLLLALPLALALRGMLDSQIGQSAVVESAGGTYDWWEEFLAHAAGLGTTFTPSVAGFAAVLDNTSSVLDNRPLAATLAGATAAWLVLWSFLSGGILDRYARQRPTRASGFFAAAGTHFWRFLRLGAVICIVYWLLFGAVHAWLFDGGYTAITRDFTSERSAFAVRMAAYVIFSGLLAAFALLFDYARIRVVVEDRRSAIGSLLAAGRFMARHAGRVGGLFLLNAVAYLVLVGAYGGLSAGAGGTDMHGWLMLALGQAYILGRHYLKLLVYASETSLFQGMLAHAAYTAAPALVWPDSPAVESITNAEPARVR